MKLFCEIKRRIISSSGHTNSILFMKGGGGKTKRKLTVKLERTLSDELIARIYIKVQPFANATLNTECFERFQIQQPSGGHL